MASYLSAENHVKSSLRLGAMLIQYSQVINRNIFLTAGISVFVPGRYIRDVVAEHVPKWTGGFGNVVFNL